MSSKPTVDFYILENMAKSVSLHFACQLIEKAYHKQQKIYVQTSSSKEAEYMDGLLWTFRDDSFLPHSLNSQERDQSPPILIGFDLAPSHDPDVLVNLCQEIPAFYTQFNRIIEIVFSEPSVQQLARERYRLYRNRECQINTHKIKTLEM